MGGGGAPPPVRGMVRSAQAHSLDGDFGDAGVPVLISVAHQYAVLDGSSGFVEGEGAAGGVIDGAGVRQGGLDTLNNLSIYFPP